jgi:kynurenine formamidase
MRRIVDLSLAIGPSMRGVAIRPAKRLETDGWNAATLELYSHCGTHLDAPRHFLPEGPTLDDLALDRCIGPARVLDLTPVLPRELITVERLAPWRRHIGKGCRLLLRTDWSRRHGTPDYRNALPRIDVALARWLVDRGVILLGVEPPSIADVNDREELTAVHRILLEGGVVIVEGLAHLDLLTQEVFDLVALPLKIRGGDGAPARVIALEDFRGL